MVLRDIRLARLLLCIAFIAATVSVVFQGRPVYAAQITERSLTLEAGATDGASMPGGVVKHKFSFKLPTGGNVGSIKFEYCTTPTFAVCVTPTGLVTTSATLSDQTGATGFTLNNGTNGAPYITRTAAGISADTIVTYELSSVTNPTATNYSFFVRISTFTSTDTTGSPIDTGSVTASTATPIQLTGIMPESIIFCTGTTISKNGGGIPDCTTAVGGNISFNQLFSPVDTATATSQMAASTNAIGGYSITVNGPTLTSGSNTIPAMAVAGLGVRGTGQFGMNLRANTVTTSTIAVGSDLDPVSNGTNLKGNPTAGYNTADTFKYVSGDVVANSDQGGVGPTDSQIYTSSYIVNVSGSQIAGTYTTTLTYICTATF